jgi:hypothetical protein
MTETHRSTAGRAMVERLPALHCAGFPRHGRRPYRVSVVRRFHKIMALFFK